MKTITNTYLGFLETNASKEITERLEAEARLEKEQRYLEEQQRYNEIMTLLPEWLEKNHYTYKGVFNYDWDYSDRIEKTLHELASEYYDGFASLECVIGNMFFKEWFELPCDYYKNEAIKEFMSEFEEIADEFEGDIIDAINCAPEDWNIDQLIRNSYDHTYNRLSDKNQLDFDDAFGYIWDGNINDEYNDLVNELEESEDDEQVADIMQQIENLRERFLDEITPEARDYLILNKVNLLGSMKEIFSYEAVKVLEHNGYYYDLGVVSTNDMSTEEYFKLLCTGEFTNDMFHMRNTNILVPASIAKYAWDLTR